MENSRPEPDSDEPRAARVGYIANARTKKSTGAFRDALEWLLPPPIDRHELVKLFEHRASAAAIKSWRFGQCAPPAWAVSLLDQQLARRMAQLDRWRQSLPAAIGDGSGRKEKTAKR